MKLGMREKLLKKLIGDIDLMGDGSESSEPGEGEKPAEMEMIALEGEEPEAEELTAESEEGSSVEASKCDECGGMKGSCDMKDCKMASAGDEESLGDDGLLPHERLRKLMNAKG